MFDYNKEGRILGRGHSPRDLQRRVGPTSNEKLVIDLMQQVSTLQKELEDLKRRGANAPSAVSGSSADKIYSVDEFNEELTRALEKEIEVIKTQYEAEIKHLKALLDAKEEVINTLKSKPVVVQTSNNTEEVKTIETDRPDIDNEVIDPSDTDTKLESHINVETTTQKVNMNDKLNKLKSIMGS
jgi:predicted  nucleic acid-binding Zn-ribbon protein